MYLRYYLNEEGERVYTIQMESPEGEFTLNAHPARFSPDDQYSGQRIKLKQKFNLLPNSKNTKAL